MRRDRIGRDGGAVARRLIVTLDELPRALALPRGLVAIHAIVPTIRAFVTIVLAALLPRILPAIRPRILTIIAALRLPVGAVAVATGLIVGLLRVIAVGLSAILGVALPGIPAAVLPGPVVELRPAFRRMAPVLIGTALLRLAIEAVAPHLPVAAILPREFVALPIHVVAGAAVILAVEPLRTIAALGLAAILLLLLLSGGDNAIVMLGVLEIILRDDAITRRRGVARQLQIFLMNLKRAAANANIGAV